MESSAENSKIMEIDSAPAENAVVVTSTGIENASESLPKNKDAADSEKVQKHRSDAWLHFTKTETGDKAKCKHCQVMITCRSKMGSSTSAMLNHMKRCKGLQPEESDDNHGGTKRYRQTTMHNQMQKMGNDNVAMPTFLSFDQEACRKAIAKYVIMDEVPFRAIQREGFKSMMKVCQPRFTLPSRRTLVRDIMTIYVNERKRLLAYFKNYKPNVCLTTDIWTSRQNLSYMSLTAHFIDDDWRLHKKIINFCQISNHSGLAIGKLVEKCLLSWGIDKVFTITVDNASANDVGLRYLRERLRVWGGSVLDGEFLHMRCGAHILNLIIKDGLDEFKDSIDRIRSAVFYVRSSPLRTQRFKTYMEQQKLHINAVTSLDVETRWNSTYIMLESALRVKKAFDLLEIEDDKYREELRRNGKGVPTEEDWLYASGFVPFLKGFYETTVKISGSNYVTGNLYMKEIFRVAFNITVLSMNGDESDKLIASKMQRKFHKYWGDFRQVNLMIYLATVLDPRHKMGWVTWLIENVYDEDEAKELVGMIERLLERMFRFYETSLTPNNPNSTSQPTNDGIWVLVTSVILMPS